MTENIDNEMKDLSTFDPLYQTENLSFEPDKLVACASCTRQNPPNRLNCIYCGRVLEIADVTSVKTHLRKLEIWERGVNIIFCSKDVSIDLNLAQLAGFLSIDAADMSMMMDAGTPLPIARVENEKEADIFLAGLEQFGLKCRLVKDDDLAADKPPVRLSAIEINDQQIKLRAFNTGNLTEAALSDLVLIVPGSIIENKVDAARKTRAAEQRETG